MSLRPRIYPLHLIEVFEFLVDESQTKGLPSPLKWSMRHKMVEALFRTCLFKVVETKKKKKKKKNSKRGSELKIEATARKKRLKWPSNFHFCFKTLKSKISPKKIRRRPFRSCGNTTPQMQSWLQLASVPKSPLSLTWQPCCIWFRCTEPFESPSNMRVESYTESTIETFTPWTPKTLCTRVDQLSRWWNFYNTNHFKFYFPISRRFLVESQITIQDVELIHWPILTS